MRPILSAMLAIAIATPCLANNNFFLPGDACFHTRLTKVKIAALKKSKAAERTFDYAMMSGHGGYFCGYAGYKKATIPSVDDAFMKNLETAYATYRVSHPPEFREQTIDGKIERIETNGLVVLFYPADFDLEKWILGLQYNENWIDEVANFGHDRNHCLLNSQVNAAEAVAAAWRDSTKVPALNAKLPERKKVDDEDEEPVPDDEPEERPVIVQGKVKAVVLGHWTPTQLYEDAHEDGGPLGATVHVVDSESVTEYEVSKGRLRKAKR